MNNNQAQVTGMVIAQVAPIIIILIIGIIIYKKFSSGISSAIGGTSKDDTKTENQETNLITLTARDGKPSYSNSQYLSFANKLEQAMKGWGTDDKSVQSVLNSIKNSYDWKMIIKTFGIRDGENLLAWLRDDFDSHNTFSVDQNDLNKILKSKGITENLI